MDRTKVCIRCRVTRNISFFVGKRTTEVSTCQKCRETASNYRKGVRIGQSNKKIQHVFIGNIESKKCSKCGEIKELLMFRKRKSNSDGLDSWCNECKDLHCRTEEYRNDERARRRNLYHRDIEVSRAKEVEKRKNPKIKEYKKQYYQEHKETNAEKVKQYRIKNKERIAAHRKEYRIKNLDTLRAKERKYYRNNREKIIKQNTKSAVKRMKTDPGFKLVQNLRCRVKNAIVNAFAKKSDKTMNLVGCTQKELVEHIEGLFTKGMTWDNYGRGENKWCVDHIKPCARFNLSDEHEQRKCFHYTNLQPLWYSDNSSKGNRWSQEEDEYWNSYTSQGLELLYVEEEGVCELFTL